MSSRSLLKFGKLLAAPALFLGASLYVSSLALAAAGPIAPPVQTYADQAAPVQAPDSQTYYDSPLAAGTLTLEDVLEAHKPPAKPAMPALAAPVVGGAPSAAATAPLLTPPVQSSSTGLMMSQGMKAVLQKVGDTAPVGAPVTVRAPAGQAADATAQPAALVAAPADVAPGMQYEPGQAPRNLVGELAPTATVAAPVAAAPAAANQATTSQPATTQAAASAAVPVAPAAASDIAVGTDTPSIPAMAAAPATGKAKNASGASCDQNVQKWEKGCAEAGYPANYVGKIVGETRTGCADGALHDVWVTNSCAPPETLTAQSAKTNGVCGLASDSEFDDAPTNNLCSQGVASAVSGDGPWNWACSGVNGGDAVACTAPQRAKLVNGSCGAANGTAVSSAPSADLCKTGTATKVKGSGPWTWTCKGTPSGGLESCIAPVAGGNAMAQATIAVPAAAAVAAPKAAPAVAAPAAPAPTYAPARVSASAPAAASSADKEELCGNAAETLAYEAPEKDLCRAGTASVVNGDGPWTWSCTNNEGVTSSCRTLSLGGDSAAPAASASEPAAPHAAPQAAVDTAAPSLQPDNPFNHPSQPVAHAAAPVPAPVVELACGLAASQPTSQAPASELCQGGKAGKVTGSGPWSWSCAKGHQKISCEAPRAVDARCGAANGTALKSAPFSGLCAAGSPSGIEGNGPWSWSCNGTGGGINVTCAASLQTVSDDKVDGTCGVSDGSHVGQAPVDGLCNSGTPSAVSGKGPWTWSCSGSDGGAVASCSASRVTAPKAPGPVVNGLCGAANGVTTSAAPTEILCASGQASALVGNGPWNWSCGGENGGMTVSCTAPLEPPAPIDGACGGANGVETLVRPQSGLCAAGITGYVNGKGPWTWTCSGANGGNPASCVAPVAGKSGAIPSVMTTASDDNVATPAVVAAAPTGLVTPRLPSNDDLSSLDKKALPSLTSSSAFAPSPTPTRVPAANLPGGDVVAGTVPALSDDSTPVPPPALRDTLPSAAVLQETPSDRAALIPGNHLTLDPTISTVLFQRGSGNIDETVLTTLDKLSNVLQGNPDVRISLIAYADNGGSTPRDARRLSLTRALAVRDYLASKGISQSRIDIHAEGANTTGYIDRVDVKVND